MSFTKLYDANTRLKQSKEKLYILEKNNTEIIYKRAKENYDGACKYHKQRFIPLSSTEKNIPEPRKSSMINPITIARNIYSHSNTTEIDTRKTEQLKHASLEYMDIQKQNMERIKIDIDNMYLKNPRYTYYYNKVYCYKYKNLDHDRPVDTYTYMDKLDTPTTLRFFLLSSMICGPQDRIRQQM